MTFRLSLALLVGALVLSPGLAPAEESSQSLEELMIEMADTPAQHAALARYFHEKAEQARAEAGRHETMTRSYAGGKMTQRQEMRRHCQKLSAKYSELAQDYEELAKLHETEAMQSE